MKRINLSIKMSDLKTFQFWFGYGSPIFLLMTLYVSALHEDSRIFYGYIVLSQVWWWESLYTTCRRCPNYGTTNCGIQGVMVEKIIPYKKSKLNHFRIRFHKFLDITYMVISVIICWKFMIPGVIGTIWVLGTLKLSFYPNRFHGLLHQLK